MKGYEEKTKVSKGLYARAGAVLPAGVSYAIRDITPHPFYIAEAKGASIVGVKGHRSVGGIRFSTYNAMTLEGIQQTVEFMEKFRKANS